MDADRLAHETLLEGNKVYEALREILPEAVSEKQDRLDAEKIANEIFSNAAKRKKVEEIIHPYVFSRLSEEIQAAKEAVVIVEVPLLYETGYDRFCDQVLVVKAGEEQIIQRLIEKGFDKKDIEARSSAQMPLEEKVKKANFVIDNSGSFEKMHQDVKRIWDQLHSDSKGVL